MGKKQFIEIELLSALRTGTNEDKALEQLYKALLPKVKMICKKYRANEIDSYDVFQESIVKLYDYIKLNKFNSEYSIEAFVLTVARNRIIDELRKKNKRSEVEIDEFAIPSELIVDQDILLNVEKKNALEHLFETIGERCKELLLLRKYDKRSMKEICEIMGFKSENSAKTQTYKCKQKLLQSIEENPSLAKEIFEHA
jgi:RNA polymerase sigma factor (sigma-70 family)